MLEATEVKLSENAKGPRVWLQGGRAKQAGFVPGIQYRCTINKDERRISLFVDPLGDRVVSRKDGDIPVIDLNSRQTLGMFAELNLSRLRVIVGEGVIHLLPLASDERRIERIERLKQNLAKGVMTTGSLSHGGVRTSLLLAA